MELKVKIKHWGNMNFINAHDSFNLLRKHLFRDTIIKKLHNSRIKTEEREMQA